jgi:hypothetical protein
MIFLHIIDDYKLQGILASMKQKKWWQEQKEYKDLYKNDYLMALVEHSFSWTFMIMLPIAFTMNFQIDAMFLILFAINVFVHAQVDNEKANKFTINLCIDQLIHLCQICLTAFILL